MNSTGMRKAAMKYGLIGGPTDAPQFPIILETYLREPYEPLFVRLG